MTDLPIVIALGRVLQRVLVEVLTPTPELREGCQLQHRHGPLQDGDRLLVDLLLFRLAPCQVTWYTFGRFVSSGLDRAVVFTAPGGNKKKRFLTTTSAAATTTKKQKLLEWFTGK